MKILDDVTDRIKYVNRMEGIHWDDIYVFYWNILLCFLFIFKLKYCLIWKLLILRDFKTIIWKLETFLDLNHEYLAYTENDLRTADIFKGLFGLLLYKA